MDYLLLFASFIAIVSPSFQFDDRPRPLRDALLPGRVRLAPRIVGGLEVVGPLGGSIGGHINGGLVRGRSRFSKGMRGNLSGGLSAQLPISGLGGAVSASIQGGSRRGIDGFGGDLSGSFQSRIGGRNFDIARSNFQASVKGGVDIPLVPVAPYVAGGYVVASGGGRCGFLTPSCRGSQQERNTVCRFTFNKSRNACVKVFTFPACIRQRHENLFRTKEECKRYCRRGNSYNIYND